jgi:hypothetical protein
MHEIFRKLQFKDQDAILVLNPPKEFHPVLDAMRRTTRVHNSLREGAAYAFMLAFVQTRGDIKRLLTIIRKNLAEDALVWVAYPKKSSMRYQSKIDRDHGWQPLGDLGFEGVRQIAIDADWSALRFRKADQIKKITREKKRAMSREGEKRAR